MPPSLTTGVQRARENALDADGTVLEAMRRSPGIKLNLFRAHHLIAMEALRKHRDLCEEAARAGWGPDSAPNVVLLPMDERTQALLQPLIGLRPFHNSGHGQWNRTIVEPLMQQIEGAVTKMPPGSTREQKARRLLEELSWRLRGRILQMQQPGDKLSLLEAPEARAA